MCFVHLPYHARKEKDLTEKGVEITYPNLGRIMSVPEITTDDARPWYAMGMWNLDKNEHIQISKNLNI